jgi:hypothetical protein
VTRPRRSRSTPTRVIRRNAAIPGLGQSPESQETLRRWLRETLTADGEGELDRHFTQLREAVDGAFAAVCEHVMDTSDPRDPTPEQTALLDAVEAYASAVSEHNVELALAVGLGRYLKWAMEFEEGFLEDPKETTDG